nr:unnamed protein product [Digitaria exilis]
MLFQVGGQGARPTFFEMSAAQQLPASLRSALTYSLGVVFPYFKSKLQSIYNKEREARLQATLWGQDDVRISRIRNRELERLRGPPWFKAVQRVFLSCMYTTLDYAQTGLIAAVFFFKMMEWWYQSAEERMSAPTVYPPPPPPPTPKVAKDGIPLPPDKTLCPLCCQKRANPSVLSVSGFVFCYSCIFKSVSQHKRCPVTLMPATVEQIRRLFHDL